MGRMPDIQIGPRGWHDLCSDGLVPGIEELERWIAEERTTLLRLVHQDKLRAIVAQSGSAFVKGEPEVLGLTGSRSRR